MTGVGLRERLLVEVSILSGALLSLRGGDEDALSVLETSETSDTDGRVMGFERGVRGVLGRRTILVTRVAVRRMDCRTFHWRFLAIKNSTAVPAIDH